MAAAPDRASGGPAGGDPLKPVEPGRWSPAAAHDFTVPSRTAVSGLRLEAADGPFLAGDGPLVNGATLALTFLDELEGIGVPIRPPRQPGRPARPAPPDEGDPFEHLN